MKNTLAALYLSVVIAPCSFAQSAKPYFIAHAGRFFLDKDIGIVQGRTGTLSGASTLGLGGGLRFRHVSPELSLTMEPKRHIEVTGCDAQNRCAPVTLDVPATIWTAVVNWRPYPPVSVFAGFVAARSSAGISCVDSCPAEQSFSRLGNEVGVIGGARLYALRHGEGGLFVEAALQDLGFTIETDAASHEKQRGRYTQLAVSLGIATW